MKYRNKQTNEVVEAKSFTELFAFTNNSNYEKVEEPKTPQDPTVKELKEKLTEMGIKFDSKAKKEDLIALLEKTENEGAEEENQENPETSEE